MEMLVECPICEVEFRIDGSINQQTIDCPACRRTIDLTQIVLRPVAPDTALPVANAPLRPSPEAQVTFAPPDPVVPPSAAPPVTPPVVQKRSSKGVHIRSEVRKRNKKKALVTAIVLSLVALVVGALGITAMVVSKNQKPSPQDVPPETAPAVSDQKTSSTQSTPPASPASPGTTQPEKKTLDPKRSGNLAATGPLASSSNTDDSTASPQPATDPDEEIKKLVRELPPQKFAFFSKKKVSSFWKDIQPRLVQLEIEGPKGHQQATGTLVDSRGWVLTSYRAIQDAWKIKITASSPSLEATLSDSPLEDLVRGIVASDPANDLALLSVNRRFVIAFSDIKVAPRHDVVTGEYLLQAAAPTRTNPYGVTEAEIKSRSRFGSLEKEAHARASRFQHNQPDTPWLVVKGNRAMTAGTPLFRDNGTLAAMIVFPDASEALALPIHPLKRLLASATDTVTPLKPSPVVSVSDTGLEDILEAESGPTGKMRTRLNRSGNKCKVFHWLPRNQTEYAAVQTFIQQLSEASQFAATSKDDDAVEEVKQAIRHWHQIVQQSVNQAVATDRKRLRTLKEDAVQAIQKEGKNQAVFYGTMKELQLGSGEQILKIQGAKTLVVVHFDPDAKPMLPDSKWLYFVETPEQQEKRRMQLEGLPPMDAYAAKLILAIGPISPK